jgi:hypothetical protein
VREAAQSAAALVAACAVPATEKRTEIKISPPNIQTAAFRLIGTAPYVQNRFGAKARGLMHDKQAAGSTAKSSTRRSAKDFKAAYEDAMHKTCEGWCGIPAPAFRNACITACCVAGFAMTRAKLAVFVLADGFDKDDGTPLVKITKGKPEYTEMAVKNDSGVCDLRARPMWREGWECVLRLRYDADMFTVSDIANLVLRAGMQVGVGEGRPASKNSCGMGWGLFQIADK